jgi:Short-chain dehydrogenases of various substrate specificities
MPSLANQVVLITGASAGIGEAVALEAAKRGARLVLAARREGLLRNVKDLVESRGAEALVVPTDMADTAQVEALAQKALDHFGRVDILVNNAGYGQMGPVEEVDVAAMRRQFEVNVFGLHALTRALLPQMRERGSGRILNLSSVAGQMSMPFSGVYSATKFAVEALSDALRVEVAPFGIKVIVIEPGPVATEFGRVAEETFAAVVNPNGPYKAILDKAAELASSFHKMAWPVEKVVEPILRAMTDPHPSDRYTAFTGGKLALGLMRLLPAALADQMWRRVYGLDALGSPKSA